jgi:hypothetical protein
MDDNKVASQLSSTINQLRAELDSAFGDVPSNGERASGLLLPPNESSQVQLLKRMEKELKLTQYLLHIKEHQLEEEMQYKGYMQAAIMTLATALGTASEDALSPEWMLSAFSGVMQSSSVALWAQTGDKYSVSAAHIAVDEAEDVFQRLIPILKHTDDPRISIDGVHHLVYTHKAGELSLILIFSRDSKRMSFSDNDIKLGTNLAKAIFKATDTVEE